MAEQATETSEAQDLVLPKEFEEAIAADQAKDAEAAEAKEEQPGQDVETQAGDEQVPPESEEASEETDAAGDEGEKAEEQPEEKAEETDTGLDPVLLARAERAGLSAESVATLGEAAILPVVGGIEAKIAEIGAAALRAGQEEEEPEAEAEPAAAAPPAEKPKDYAELADEYGPGIVKIMQQRDADEAAREAKWRERVGAIEKRLETIAGSVEEDADEAEQQRDQMFTNYIDDKVTALGEDFAHVFGKGRAADLARGGEAFRAREALGNQIVALGTGFQALDKPVPPIDELFQMALQQRCGELITEIAARKATTELEGKIKKHNKRATGRPTGKRRTAKTADEEAEKAAAEWLKQQEAAGPGPPR